MATVLISKNDPQNALAAYPLFDATIRAALDLIDRHVVLRGTVEVEVLVETTGTGRFAGGGDISFAGQRNGIDTWESALLAESRSGVDPAPTTSDLQIYVDPRSDYLAGLWWDPAIATSLAGRPPDDRTDAFSVVLHEILHGMGITGWRDIETGALTTPYQSSWDALVQVSAGQAAFTGAATQQLLGAPVEVRLGGSQGAFHLGDAPLPGGEPLSGSSMPWLENDLMNGYHFYLGERYLPGRLDLALLQDLGWTLRPTTLVDVTNRWDDAPGELYRVGWDTDEQISGDVLADRLEGRGGKDLLIGLDGNDWLLGGDGNDTLRGGAGDDHLDGGAGIDSAALSGARSLYRVTIGAAGATVTALAGSDGTDALVGVERLQFSDIALALDLDGHAGTTARLIAATFGAAAVAIPQYVGIGLAQLDAGTTPLQLAQLALDARLGAGASASDIVTTLYTQVVGVAPGPAQLAQYTGMLASGAHTPASLTLLAAETDLVADLIGLDTLTLTGLPFVGT